MKPRTFLTPLRVAGREGQMPTRNPSILRFVALVCCLEFLLLASNAFAQDKSAPASQKMTAESHPVVVDVVKIEGGTELSAAEKTSIADKLRGETAHADWLDKLNANATRQLQDDGFFDGTAVGKVESTRILDGKENVTVVLVLTCGTRYTIQKVWWAGSSIFSPAQLDNLVLLRVGDMFRPSALNQSISILNRAYAQRGYSEVYVGVTFQKYSKYGKVDLYLDVVEGQKSGESRPLQCKQLSVEDIQDTPYVPSLTYDPKIDGQIQIARAELEAQRTKKKLLLIAGDSSCGWCRVLDQTFQRHPAISELRDSIFIVLHINVSDENSNECALKAYPRAPGYPFVYVLDATGKLLGTEDTMDWESSDGYDSQKIESFLRK
jgi:hypothetical protein